MFRFIQDGEGAGFIRDGISSDSIQDGGQAGGPSGGGFENLGTEYDPVGLWLFDGDIQDSSGNDYHLSVASGTPSYRTFGIPGTQGLYFDGELYLTNAGIPELRITGDLTIQVIVNLTGTGVRSIVGQGAIGESLETNFLYLMQFETTPYLNYIHEYNAGSNAIYLNSSAGAWTREEVSHLMMVRENNVITYYKNGSLYGSPSGTLTAPAGGTSTITFVGANDGGGNRFEGHLQSLKIIDRALNASERAAEFAKTGFTS